MIFKKINKAESKPLLTKEEKAAVLFLFLEQQSEDLSQELIKELSSEKRSQLYDTLSKGKIYNEETVQEVVGEVYQMLVNQKAVFPRKKLLNSLKKEMGHKTEELGTELSQSSLLASASLEQLKELIISEPSHFGAVLFHLLDQEQLAEVISDVSEEKTQKIIECYTEFVPKNEAYLTKFLSYVETQALKTEKPAAQVNLKKVSRLLELLPKEKQDYYQKNLAQGKESSLKEISENMFQIKDLSKFSQKDLGIIFENFNNPKDLALLFQSLGLEQSNSLKSILSERLQEMIQEEMESLPETISDEQEAASQRLLVQKIRSLEDQEKISSINGNVMAN